MGFLPAEMLIDMCLEVKKNVFITSPFIKAGVLEKVLEAIQKLDCEVTVVTRWKAEEVAAGVSDLEVYDLLRSRKRTRLLLHPCLHAKYYRVDSRCLVGSANLTAKAMGWASVSNIEILVEVDPIKDGLIVIEDLLLSEAIEATEEIKNSVMLAAHEMQSRGKEGSMTLPVKENMPGESAWLPTCVKPEYLYRVYKNAGISDMLDSTVMAAREDLEELQIVEGLVEDEFKRYLAASLGRVGLVQKIAQISKSVGITPDVALGLVFEVRNNMGDPRYEVKEYWDILKAWLVYFYPDRYRLRASEEVLEQARILP